MIKVSRLESENNELSRKLEKLTNSMDEQARLHNSQVIELWRWSWDHWWCWWWYSSKYKCWRIKWTYRLDFTIAILDDHNCNDMLHDLKLEQLCCNVFEFFASNTITNCRSPAEHERRWDPPTAWEDHITKGGVQRPHAGLNHHLRHLHYHHQQIQKISHHRGRYTGTSSWSVPPSSEWRNTDYIITISTPQR